MDKIQKELLKLGRKDLAQEYYLKVAGSTEPKPSEKFKTFSEGGTTIKIYEDRLFLHRVVSHGPYSDSIFWFVTPRDNVGKIKNERTKNIDKSFRAKKRAIAYIEKLGKPWTLVKG